MYRTVDTALFFDPKIRAIRKEEPLAVYLFLYLFQNSHTHLCGIYHISKAIICDETGISDRVYDTLCNTLSRVGLCKFDQKLEVVYVRKMFKYQGRGEKNEKAASVQLQSLHHCHLIADFLEDYPSVKKFCDDNLAIPYQYPIDRVSVQEQEQEQNKEQKQNKTTYAANDKNRSPLKQSKIEFVDGEFKNIPEKRIEAWKKAYPAIDIQTEILDAAEWLIANPSNHKSNYQRYLVNWFKRSQDKAPRTGRMTPQGKNEQAIKTFLKE